MNTLQVYNLIIKVVTHANRLAVALRDDKTNKKDALEKFKTILEDAQDKVK